MRNIRIAAAISRAIPFDLRGNFDAMVLLVRQARSEGAEIVCFPEMNITGYTNNPAVAEAAETVPGPLSRDLQALADDEDIIILAGMAERSENGDGIYIAQLVARPGGSISDGGVYRKLHMAPPEQAVYRAGEQAPLFDADGVRFGVQLCYDAHFPELSTLMAQNGADVIFIPHASPRGTPEDKYRSWMRHLPARAFDNSLFIVACNPTGETERGVAFPGLALVIDPSGKVIAQKHAWEASLLIADLESEALDRVRGHKMRFFFPNRRPRLYERIRNSGIVVSE